jgi:hypothetical protein
MQWPILFPYRVGGPLLVASMLIVGSGHLARAGNATHHFHVTSSADTGGSTCAENCTLRQAINAFNNAAFESSEIDFFIGPPGTVSVIRPSRQLPSILRPNLTINGYTNGASPNTLADGDDAVILVEIDGAESGSQPGLQVCARHCTIQGLSLVRFSSDRGAVAVGPGNQVSLICGEFGFEIADHAVIQGNFIGIDPQHDAAGNSLGIDVRDANTTIGGTSPAARNVIAANDTGIFLEDTDTPTTLILGNVIGLGPSGISMPNGVGIDTRRNPGSSIGSTTAPNRIAYAAAIGIRVPGPAVHASTGMSAAANDFIGPGNPIDLATGATADGITPNDADDTDDGGNHVQNFPVLETAVLTGGQVIVEGDLDIPHAGAGAGTRPYTIVAYASAACDANGHGPGELFLGGEVVDLSDGVNVLEQHFVASFAAAPPGSQITATATDDITHDVSEMSGCIPLAADDEVFGDGFDGSP